MNLKAKIITRWITLPIAIPVLIAVGHMQWLFSRNIEYKWVWELIPCYLLADDLRYGN